MLVSLVPRLSRAGARESLGTRLMSCGPRSDVHNLLHTRDHCHPHLLYTVTVLCYQRGQSACVSARVQTYNVFCQSWKQTQ